MPIDAASEVQAAAGGRCCDPHLSVLSLYKCPDQGSPPKALRPLCDGSGCVSGAVSPQEVDVGSMQTQVLGFPGKLGSAREGPWSDLSSLQVQSCPLLRLALS